MTWIDKALTLVKKHGAAAKFATRVILGTIPGGAVLIPVTDEIFDAAGDAAQDNWEQNVSDQIQLTSDNVARLDQVLDILSGDLQYLMAQIASLQQTPELAARLLEVAKENDDRCQVAFAKLDTIVQRFDRLESQNLQIMTGQRHAIGLIEEIHRMMSGGGVTPSATPDTADALLPVTSTKELIVAKEGPANFRSITEALQQVVDGGIIHIRAGHYQEALEITRPVSLKGEGSDKVTVQAFGSRALSIVRAAVVIHGFTLHAVNPAGEDGDAEGSAVTCEDGQLDAAACRIVCEGSRSVHLKGGASTTAKFASCQIQDVFGVVLADSARAVFEGCRLDSQWQFLRMSARTRATFLNSTVEGGVFSTVEGQAECLFRACKLALRSLSGLHCQGSAALTVEDSDVFGYFKIGESATASFQRSKVESDYANTIWCKDKGQFHATDCAIARKDGTAISASDSSEVKVLRGKIEASSAVTLGDKATLLSTDCDILVGNGSGIRSKGTSEFKLVRGKIEGKSGLSVAENAVANCQEVHFAATDEQSTGVLSRGEAELRLERCKFTDHATGVRLEGTGSPRVLKCTISGRGSEGAYGIIISDSNSAVIEGCDVSGFRQFAAAGVEVAKQSECTIRDCRIHHNAVGISIRGTGCPTVEGCDLRDNDASMSIKTGSEVYERGNRS